MNPLPVMVLQPGPKADKFFRDLATVGLRMHAHHTHDSDHTVIFASTSHAGTVKSATISNLKEYLPPRSPQWVPVNSPSHFLAVYRQVKLKAKTQ